MYLTVKDRRTIMSFNLSSEVCDVCGCALEDGQIGLCEACFEERAAKTCRAAGWDFVADSDLIEAWCGDRSGVVHLPTLLGWDHHNDSVYETFAACLDEAISPAARSYSVDELAKMHIAVKSLAAL